MLCVGRYIDAPADRFGKWIGLGAVLLFLAIMTKGVAAGMAVPGLLVYAIVCRRLLVITRDWRLWASAAGVFAGVAGWLALREHLDPGYFAAMWYNDVGGRLLIALEHHSAGPLYYLKVLAFTFQPAVLLLPMVLAVRRDRDPARRQLCLLTTLSAASWIIALSCAGTKIYWYVAPVVPLLAIAVASGTTSFLRQKQPPLSNLVVIRPVIVTLLLTFWYLNVRAPDGTSFYAADQAWYGPFLNKIRDKARLDGAVIVDQGLPNEAGFQHYNPIARFFAEDAGRRGEHMRLAAPGTPLAKDATIISCDPRVRDWLKPQSFFGVIQSDTRCVLGRIAMPPDNAVVPGG